MAGQGKNGISIYFRYHIMNIHRGAINAIGKPKYIHLLINRQEKKMFIQGCEQDRDAFKVYYAFSGQNHNVDQCHIRSKWFIEYFADMLGVAYDSESLCFSGILLEDSKTIQIDLNQYEVIAYQPEQEGAS